MGAFFWFLWAQGWTWGTPLNWTDPLYRQATGVTFAAIVMGQVANAFTCRDERASAFTLGWLTNRLLLWGIAVELVLMAVILYSPIGSLIFGTAPLPAWVWPPLLAGGIGLLLADEYRKWLIRRAA